MLFGKSLLLAFLLMSRIQADYLQPYTEINKTLHLPSMDEDRGKETVATFINHICDILDLTNNLKTFLTETVIFVEPIYFNRLTSLLNTCTTQVNHINHVKTINDKDLETTTELSRELLRLKSTYVKTFILLIPLYESSVVLNVAERVGMLKDVEYTWFVVHKDATWSFHGNVLSNLLVLSNTFHRFPVTRHPSDEMLFSAFRFKKQGKLEQVAGKPKNGTVDIVNEDLYISVRKKVLRFVTIVDPPFISKLPSITIDRKSLKCPKGSRKCWDVFSDPKTKQTKQTFQCCFGFCIDLLLQIELDMMLDVYLYLIEDGYYGAKVNGTWNGMIADVIKDKADVIIAPIIVTSIREQAVDFSKTFLHGGMAIATTSRVNKVALFGSSSSDPFTFYLWFVIFLLTIIPGVSNYLIEKYVGKRKNVYFIEFLLSIVSLTFQRDIGGTLPKRASSNVILISVASGMLVIMSTYTAVLTAKSVTQVKDLPISGFKDKKLTDPSTTFIFGVENNTAYEDKFRTSNDPTWNRMYYFMKKHAFDGVHDGIEKLKTGKVAAIITDLFVLQYYISKEKSCHIHIAGNPIPDVGYGIVVKKGSRLKARFSQLVLKYESEFYIRSLKTKWLHNKCYDTINSNVFGQLDIYFLKNFFYIGAGGLVFSFIVFVCEYYVSRIRQKNVNTR